MFNRELKSVSPGQLRLLKLCPRLLIHEYLNKQLALANQPLLPRGQWTSPGEKPIGSPLFQRTVIDPVLASLKNGSIDWYQKFLDAQGDIVVLEQEFNRTFLQAVLANHLQQSQLGNSADQLPAYFQGVSLLAKYVASFGSSRLLGAPELRPQFLEAEEKFHTPMTHETLGKFQMGATCDALVFDPVFGEYNVLELKCKDEIENIGDEIQLAGYAWILHQRTGCRVSGAILHVNSNSHLKWFTHEDLAERFPEIEALIAKAFELRRVFRRRSLHHNYPAVEDRTRCQFCTLDPVCDERLGQRL
jgi:CRISPR/Cas system-associated exonuclease Cas4 (RecB family)